MLTEHGVVGKSLMAPNAPTHAILWSGFEIDKVEVRQYDGPRCQNLCADDKTGLNAPPVPEMRHGSTGGYAAQGVTRAERYKAGPYDLKGPGIKDSPSLPMLSPGRPAARNWVTFLHG